MTTRRLWTTAEVAKLRAMARHMDAPSIAEELGRTARAVDSMVGRLGLSMKALRAWTKAEDETLRKLGSKLSIAKLAKRLCRSPDVLTRRARELGISLLKRGEFHHHAKHPPAVRRQYLALRASGTAQQTAAKLVGVHPSTARRWESPR